MVGKAESRLPTEREAFYTPTEREVLRLYALGLTRAASAQRMDIAQHTVTNHRSNIVSKTPGAACMVDALRFIGWLQPPA